MNQRYLGVPCPSDREGCLSFITSNYCDGPESYERDRPPHVMRRRRVRLNIVIIRTMCEGLQIMIGRMIIRCMVSGCRALEPVFTIGKYTLYMIGVYS